MSQSDDGHQPIDQHYQGKSIDGLRDDVLDANFPERMTRRADAEAIAQAFHESYERQAEAHGYTTREASRVPWADVPPNNKQLMVAVATDLLERHVIESGTGARLAGGLG